MRLLVAATILSVILGVLVGIIGAVRQYTAFDYTMTFLAFLFFSIPTAVLAGFLKEFGAIKTNPWLRHPSMSGRLQLLLLIARPGVWIPGDAQSLQVRARATHQQVLLGAAAGLGSPLRRSSSFKLGWDGNVYRKRNPKPLIPTVGQTTPGFEGSFWARTQDYFWHMLLPSISLILIGFAGYSRYMRASMLDVMSSDYVRTARAKGICGTAGHPPPRRSQRAHPVGHHRCPRLRRAAQRGDHHRDDLRLGGHGPLLHRALTEKDPRSLLAFVMVTAVSVVVFNLLADIIYAHLDPRIRLD